MALLLHADVADRRYLTARSACLLACAALVVLFVVALPARWTQVSTLTDLPSGVDAAELRANLADSRLSLGFYAGYLVAMQVAFAVVCVGLAVAMLWRGGRRGMVLFVALLLVLLGTTFWNTVGALAAYDPAWGTVGNALGALAKLGLLGFLFVFPDGRFVPGWTRWVAVVLAVGLVVEVALGDVPYAVSNWPVPLFALLLASLLGIGCYAQVHRYRHVSGPVERQQTKWVVAGVVGALAAFITIVVVAEVLLSYADPGTPGELVSMTLVTLALLLVPVSIGIAVLRHRLFDIDLIINRALVWTVLSVAVAGGYVLVVGYLGSLFRTESSLPISLAAAGLVAVGFAPLHDRVQRGVNHLMFGTRDDPYAVLSRLGERLESTLVAQDVLPVAVATVAEALKVPYVAVEVDRDGAPETLADTGTPVPDPVVLPLTYAGERVGSLLLGRRAGESDFAPADRRLLGDLVRQIGVAVHTVGLAEEARLLSADLQRSRERLVSAREEERRRLRRDLHDGLGPRLAGMTMTAEAARDLLAEHPERAAQTLDDLVHQAHEALADVRRVVDDLRPPALDALGLVEALRSATTRQEAGGLRVEVAAPDVLPSLPAAVEVAAYRIVLEAVSNAARHARATRCDVRIAPADDVLAVEVTDDGTGLVTRVNRSRRTGVGLSSMRERAAELGGELCVGPGPSGGTRVLAHLPLGTPP